MGPQRAGSPSPGSRSPAIVRRRRHRLFGHCSRRTHRRRATSTELEAICADTAAQLDALPDPPDGITITEFATQASSILTGEAEQVRELDPPDDLDDDHRALIANDEDQAARLDRSRRTR